ncbi:MAG: indole-3-glycerol phosphate synthase TrpC [Clostridiales bacterium]|jgi:indole-3-glycerol phosphate synthase|nr:indole-3-glycerol phosphate synthase TrpC [Clostridiales bacterium]
MILNKIIGERYSQLEREKAAFGFTGEIALINVKKSAQRISAESRNFKTALKGGKLTIIAEVKKASPSKGIIREDFEPVKIAQEYENAGAAAVSVLTEEKYFLGNNVYLQEIKANISLPVLRKDFITEPFQIYHARVLGADAVLLIAAALEKNTMKELVKTAKSLSMYVLAEIHNEEDAEKAMESGAEIIGINNRDLKTFNVDLAVTERLIKYIKGSAVKVSESGIKTPQDLKWVRECGADAALIGETLMRGSSAGEALKELLEVK